MFKIISSQVLDELSHKAANSPRKRLNLNYHNDLADPINRMLNAFEPDTYVQPHKHENPDKREIFVVLRGSLAVIFFDNDGTPTEFVLLNRENGNYAVEIEPGTWHTVISLEAGSVVYEIKDGPYFPENDKNFAGWAPKEGTGECNAYLKKLTELFYSI
jgi:cupin fold WbuC family metalloprotein